MRSPPPRLTLPVLLLGLVVLLLAAGLRAPEYDEGYTAFVTGTNPRPDWPAAPFTARSARAAFRPAPTPWQIGENLRRTDVHPPLYFWTVWAWRRVVGSSLFASRLLSVLFSLGALALLAAIAKRARYPVWPALLITLGSYGFVETGIVMRGFALAQCLMLAGLLFALRAGLADSPAARAPALGAGLFLGAATFTNYLTGFTALAAWVWLLRQQPRRALWLLAGFLPFLGGDLFFLLTQRASRIGQFPPFGWGPMAGALVRAAGGALVGGLPLYVPLGLGRVTVVLLLGGLLASLLLLPWARWQAMGHRSPHSLFALASLAPPFGLCAMGLLSNSVPVEIRYLCFAIPPLALLVAAALDTWPSGVAAAYRISLLTVQALAIAGLMTRPETMQPERAAARAAWAAVGPTGLVLLPRGNDGVGIVSAFVTAAPGPLHILLVSPQTTPAALAAALCLTPWPRVTAALIAADRESHATLPLLREGMSIAAGCDEPSAVTRSPYRPGHQDGGETGSLSFPNGSRPRTAQLPHQ